MLLFVGPWLWVLLQSFNASLNSPITGVGTDLEPPLADKDDARPGTPTTGGKITYKSWTLNPWVIGQAAIWRVLKAHVKHFNFKPLLCLQTALDFFCLCCMCDLGPDSKSSCKNEEGEGSMKRLHLLSGQTQLAFRLLAVPGPVLLFIHVRGSGSPWGTAHNALLWLHNTQHARDRKSVV